MTSIYFATLILIIYFISKGNYFAIAILAALLLQLLPLFDRQKVEPDKKKRRDKPRTTSEEPTPPPDYYGPLLLTFEDEDDEPGETIRP